VAAPGHDLDGDPVLGQGRDRLVRELRPRRPSTKRLLAVQISEAVLSDPSHLAYPSQPARSSIETP
jgi:hypothetical protein